MGLREDAIDRARKAIQDLAVASCDCPYESERELAAEVGRLVAENVQLRDDMIRLGNAFAGLYLQALNGVVCDPTRSPCGSCANAFTLGREVLDRLDPEWGSTYRSCANFDPRMAKSELGEQPVTRQGCCCCGAPIAARDPDPWEGRLDGYCYECALARCDAYPGECPNA